MTAPDPSTGHPLHGGSIVCVGFADWDTENWTNQHHLMSRLAKDNMVLFVESLGLRRPTVTRRDLGRIARRLRRAARPLRYRDGVHVLSPLVVPYHSNRAVSAANTALLQRLVGHSARRLGIDRPILWAYVPQALHLVGTLRPSHIVYHCVDDIAAHERIDTPSFRALEGAFVPRADLVIASSAPIAERLRPLTDKLRTMPNVADTALFARALEPGPVDPALDTLPRPRIVFIGAISALKVDFRLIRDLARARSDWSIVLVGPVGLGDPSTDVGELEAEPNVHLVGHRSQGQLPAVLRGADVGLIPYRLNDLTASVFPMKVYEYLAAGVPVVSTPLPSLDGVEEVAFAADAAATAGAVARLLAADDPTTRRERSRRAAKHSWEERLAELEQALADTR
jgi:glycosyltransferase involved in cell wall biosynthesis